ncbi:hypothetical protein B1C78_10130 [Thioalkalivibrio denitrificans]|uniref:DUF3330 domain-containing protein n=1 Tax=Thioalkalivibrio denitrificans TaxID=108003 RepID=A0A1V3NGH1_9GAMM|nr:DUF3330 domain-containing protein [Thioalkalivibrio denitrificans]OOG23876.1 hypothetical protein B1C78_10130 [Thioalkalivibrio denitrificans]
MANKPHPTEPELIACEICLRELPSHESHSVEEDEYVQHFCGLECYDLWRRGLIKLDDDKADDSQ